MEELLKQILSQNGVIAFLFVSTFFMFVYRGIPYLLSKFDNVTTLFSDTIQQLQESHKESMRITNDTHKEDMKLISEVFINQVKESNINHHITHAKLEEILKNQPIRQK